MQLQNYAAGQWIAGSGKQSDLIDAITGDLIGTTISGGLDFGYMLQYAAPWAARLLLMRDEDACFR